ncbi:GNAT family N-acetyltransferase [Streptomyces sp. NPDC051940]|uniref:GNAT family N-acetyltransferase n=1 Tax=Streptomyces sp. NPDC051940 TaxID=3155675 RepID=UPI003426A384
MTTTLRPTGPERPEADGGRSRDYEVCVNGRPVGSVHVRTDERGGPEAGRIRDLRIAEPDRHCGRGTVAALAAEEVLRGWGCRRILISVPASATTALGLASALGYVETGRRLSKTLTGPPDLPPGSEPRPLTRIEYPAWQEAAAAAFVEVRVRAGTPRELAERSVDESYRVQLPQGADTPGNALLVLGHEGTDVGYVWVAPRRPYEPYGWVFDVEVHPAYRGRGHGRTLMLLAERECLAAGVDRLGLNVFADNPVALRLYESLGYTPAEFHFTKPLR